MKNLDNSLLLDLVAQYGSPLYIYNKQRIQEQYNTLKNAIAYDNLAIHYAMKANSNPHLLIILKNLGSHIDAVSLNEIKLAKFVGFDSNKIIFTPSFCSEEDILQAFDEKITINIGNLELLEFIGRHISNAKVGLRFIPEVTAGGHSNITVGHAGSKFGLPKEDIPKVIKLCQKYSITINGIHMHVGSDILEQDAFNSAIDFMFNTAESFSSLEYIDFGGGFKIAYKIGDNETNIEDYGQVLGKRMSTLSKKRNKSIKIRIEPGKYLLSAAGSFVVKVNGVKTTPVKTFIGVNSGLNHLIRPMFYNSYHHIHNISNEGGPYQEVDVVGYICENDTFGFKRMMSKTVKGDYLSIENAGAYCFSMASNYNSQLLPAEILVDGQNVKIIRKRQTYNQMIETIAAI